MEVPEHPLQTVEIQAAQSLETRERSCSPNVLPGGWFAESASWLH